ncbi:MAG: hypothetical protein QNJ64_19600 [Crocosphaera sp.]|nr:hypothetical protein [Crocosphaera sp.]
MNNSAVEFGVKEARDEALAYLDQHQKTDAEQGGICSFRADGGDNFLEKAKEMRSLRGMDEITSKRSKIYKFRQEYHDIPIFKSSIVVSHDIVGDNEDHKVTSSEIDYLDYTGLLLCLVESKNCQSENRENREKKIQQALVDELEMPKNIVDDYLELNASPYFYHDDQQGKWRLVYVTDSELKLENASLDELESIIQELPELKDCIIDACSGQIISTFVRQKISSID